MSYPSTLFQPKTNYRINEDTAKSNNLTCGTECLFKFDFQEQSKSFKACLLDSSANNLNMPYINITNEYLSNTSNTGTAAVNFQTQSYWFNSIYITKPGHLFMDSKISGIYRTSVLTTDPSACSLLIVCYNGENSYLTIVQNILPKSSISTNTRTSTLTDIIVDINQSLLFNDVSFNSYKCPADSIPVKTINTNNLIPRSNPFFYYSQQSTSVTFNYIIIGGEYPINITTDTMKIIENFYTQSSGLPSVTYSPPTYVDLPRTTDKVFISSQPPINNIYEGEDNIYIKCQPTDQEGNILVSGQSVSPSELDQFNFASLVDFNNNIFTSAILGIFIMVVIIKGGEYLLKNGTRTLLGGD